MTAWMVVAVGAGLPAPPDVLLYGGRTTIGIHGLVLLLLGLALAGLRPSGGGQLVALWRSILSEGGETNLSTGVLLLEVIAVVTALVGLVGTLVFGRIVAPCKYDCGAGYSPTLASAFGYTGSGWLLGSLAVGVLLLGLALWGAAWVAEGLSVTRSRPWRDG